MLNLLPSISRLPTLLDDSISWMDRPTPAWVKTSDGQFLDSNDAFASLIGTSPRGLVNRHDSAIFAEREVRRFRNDDHRVLNAGHIRIFLEPPDSIDDVWCATVKFPLRAGSRHALTVGALSFPVTDWLRLEEHIRVHGLARPSDWLSEVRAIIDARFRSPLRLESLAKRVDKNRDHVGRAFFAQTGLTVSQYIRARRVAWAADQIRTSDLKLADVALHAGFSDQSHMTREFRTFTGRTPGDFRQTDGLVMEAQTGTATALNVPGESRSFG